MLIPPRIIHYPLCHPSEVEINHWAYHTVFGPFGAIIADFENDKFSWNPTISYEQLKPCDDSMSFDVPLFRYDSSRKNMKPAFKWTNKQKESFHSPINRPFDLIGIFTVSYRYGNLPTIEFNPWERKPWQNST